MSGLWYFETIDGGESKSKLREKCRVKCKVRSSNRRHCFVSIIQFKDQINKYVTVKTVPEMSTFGQCAVPVRDHSNSRTGTGRAQYRKCHHVISVQFRYRISRLLTARWNSQPRQLSPSLPKGATRRMRRKSEHVYLFKYHVVVGIHDPHRLH